MDSIVLHKIETEVEFLSNSLIQFKTITHAFINDTLKMKSVFAGVSVDWARPRNKNSTRTDKSPA